MNPKDNDNLIIHGDNLHALKALLPRYAGRVNCIYIDPPYNTGNEGWVYNDNVNSDMMQEWLKNAEEVDGEDLERHDKWMCMMWPRLQLLKELLSDDGAIFVSIDDNEQYHLRMTMDEIFGKENFVASIIWQHSLQSKGYSEKFSVHHNYILCYSSSSNFKLQIQKRTNADNINYSNPDNDPKGLWRSGDVRNSLYRKNLIFNIISPSGNIIKSPPKGWRWSKETIQEKIKEGEIMFNHNETKIIRKIYLKNVVGRAVETIWFGSNVGTTRSASEEIKSIFNELVFDTPKPHTLIEQILRVGADKNAIILDSFAGSGTTAHSVLSLNKQDGGNRKFILVECEDYANTVTAERVRRVICGIPTSKNFKEPLGGSFTYCTLGDPLDVNQMLAGNLPDYSTLATHLLYTATGVSVNKKLRQKNKDGLFYSFNDMDYYLLYKQNMKYLQSDKSLLDYKHAERIRTVGKNATVFGTGTHMDKLELARMKISFASIPEEILKM